MNLTQYHCLYTVYSDLCGLNNKIFVNFSFYSKSHVVRQSADDMS